MSSRIFQNVIMQMKDSLDRTIGVVDESGVVAASNELSLLGSRIEGFDARRLEGLDRAESSGGRTFLPLACAGKSVDYAVFAEGEDSLSRMICSLAAVA